MSKTTVERVKSSSRLLYLIYFLSVSIGCLSAQNQVAPSPYGQWIMYFGDNKINQKIGIHSELQLRNYFLKQTVSQTLSRIGLNYYVSPLFMATAGYGFIDTRPSNERIIGTHTVEHRIWQQLILRQKTRAVFMEHRYRLEQRFIENVSTKGSLLAHRARYRFQIIMPFYTISPHLRQFFFAAYNELFMNIGTKVSAHLYDRNRLYFALGFQVSPKLNFQLGYLNQTINSRNATSLEINHNLQIAVMFNMDDIMPSFFKQN